MTIYIDVRDSDKLNGNKSLFCRFKYDNTLVTLMRNMSRRYWHSDKKEWEIPFMSKDEIEYLFKGYEVILTNYNEPKAKNIIDYKFKTKPFKHQIDAFNYGMECDKWLLGDEQGLGKTKTVIDIATAKKEKLGYKHCLIICCVNGLKWNWRNEIKTHSNEGCWILGQKVKGEKITIGSNTDKLNDLKNINSISEYFIITNIETLRVDKISSYLKDLCNNGEIQMIAVDEVHKCANPSSMQSKGLLKLNSECKIAMTGTPLMNRPTDLYMILKWLNYEKHTFYAFKNHYCVLGGFGGYDVVGYKNLSELQNQLEDIMLRRLKSDVFDLPEKLYIDEYVEMSTKQSQLYNEVLNSIKSNIDKIKMSNNPLSELIRLRQVTGYTGILSSTIQESAKLDRLCELVEESVDNNKKVVIFSNWLSMTEAIDNKLRKKFKGLLITGETKDAERIVNVSTFQRNPDCNYICGTIGAIGTGLTLTAGTVVIFIDEPWTRASYDQAVDRCHRIGTTENITVYNLICRNTIDERIHQIVQNKGALSDMIVDGKVIGNKLEILEYLLS